MPMTIGKRSIEQIRGVAHDKSHFTAAKFREVDGAQESDGNTVKACHKKQLGAADISIGHAAARFADGSRQFRKKKFQLMEIPPLWRQIAQDEEKSTETATRAQSNRS